MNGIKQKKYRGKNDKVTDDDKLKQHLTSLLVGGKTALPVDENSDFDVKIPEAELHLIEDFLDKFIFISDSSTSKDLIDLNLALKALPLKVEETNIYRIDLINFNLIQKSLIAFQNDDQDELFNYYDNRNKQRFRKIAKKAGDNDQFTDEIKTLAEGAKSSLERLLYILGTTGISNIQSDKEKAYRPNNHNDGNTFMKVVPIEALNKKK